MTGSQFLMFSQRDFNVRFKFDYLLNSFFIYICKSVFLYHLVNVLFVYFVFCILCQKDLADLDKGKVCNIASRAK